MKPSVLQTLTDFMVFSWGALGHDAKRPFSILFLFVLFVSRLFTRDLHFVFALGTDCE